MKRRKKEPEPEREVYETQIRTVHRNDGTWRIYVKIDGQLLRFRTVETYELWLRGIHDGS